MEPDKDEEKTGSNSQSSESLEQTARSKVRDLKPEKDPMGSGGGVPPENALPGETTH